MNTVEPIRGMEDITRMKEFLKGKSDRDYILFVLGISVGFRIGDALQVRVSDVRNKTHLCIRESKPKKENRILINEELKKKLNLYTKDMADNDYLFPSRKGNKPISRQQAYRIINGAAKAIGLRYKVGTHSSRKTFSHHLHKQCKDVGMVSVMLNHSGIAPTLRYLDLTQESKDATMMAFSI